MAIYHLSAKPVQRSKGRSVVAAIAYRSGCVILDKRTGIKHDYTKKYKSGGIVHSEIVVPDGIVIPSRNDLWNWAELSEKRKDACTGREYEVNLPYELSDQQRVSLTQTFSKFISNQFGVAVDFSIHKPTQRDIKGGADPRNYHAHIMTTTRKITNDGLTEKADIEKAGRKRKLDLENIRKLWADTTNKFLKVAGLEQRIDHRSLEAQGVNRKPTIKMGWESMAAERAGYRTVKGDINRAIQADNEQLAQYEADLKLLRQQAERQADEAFEKQFYEMLGPVVTRFERERQEKERKEKLRLEQERQERERQEQLWLEYKRQEEQRRAYEQRITGLTRQTGRADKAIARSKQRITATKQRTDGTEQALAGAIPDPKRYSGRLSQLRLHCERIKRNVENTEQTIERASQLVDSAKRFIDRTQQTINRANQEIKQLEQQRLARQRQEKARQEQLLLEQERQAQEQRDRLQLERERQEKARQEQLWLEQERYKRSMLIEYPFFETPLAYLAKPKLSIKVIEGGFAIPKQIVSLEYALNLYKQFAGRDWVSDSGETIALEFERIDQNNKTEQLMCDRFIELADRKETQNLEELVHDFLTKTPFEIHLIRMAELTGEMSAVRYNAYSEKINYYSKLDFQIQRDGFSMANKLQNNAQPDEINKNQSKIKIEQLIKNLDCKKYYEPRQHSDLNLVEFLQQTNATISKSELEKVNDTIEELIVAEQAQQEQLQLEQERQAQAELKYRGPTRENHASNTRDRDDGPSFNF
ncbi:MobA/MobL family protein [Moraxella osloensis]|nr:MobA/MobL family protein [Moraxella osloensis]MBW4017017.1 MobA/MobL family protein [Moraxella osloensis]